MKHIASRDNALFKQLLKLAQSSHERKKSGQTLLDGVHVIESYRDVVGAPRALIISHSGAQNAEVQTLLSSMPQVAVSLLSDALFNEIAPVQTPVGVVALIDTPAPASLPERWGSCVVLEALQDPGNLGAILRTAAAAGMERALLSQGCTFAWAPRVIRAGMGAHFALNIHEQLDLQQTLPRYRGLLLALDTHAEKSIYEIDLRGDVAFLIGNEGAGLSADLLQLAHERVRIPMLGKVESLNAAAAAAVCAFEWVRQRTPPGT